MILGHRLNRGAMPSTHRSFGQSALCALALAAAISAMSAAACAAAAEKPLNVLLITVDNLRPDHMSVYGYGKDTTPNLVKFAEDSAVFENAFSVSAWTTPGVVSLFTGYYPPVHGQTGRYSYYDKEMTSALRVLAAHGYEIRGEGIHGPGHEDLGFERLLGRRPDQLEDFVDGRTSDDPPFFAWAHLRNVHLPYTPSQRDAERFGASGRTSEGIEAVRNYSLILRGDYPDVDFVHAGHVDFTVEDIPEIRALYDGEVAGVDERIGHILDKMRETGVLDHTVVIITADHGEELFDHGWVGHASTGYDGKLYDELIRVPLILRVPDGSLAGRFDALVQSVDLMPSIFEILGLRDTGMVPPMQGTSFVPVIKGEREKIRDFIVTQTTLKGWTTPKEELYRRVVSVRSRTHKLIWFPDAEGTRIEGYDLRQDPAETKNVYPEKAEGFAYLEQALAQWWKDNEEAAANLVLSAAERQTVNIARAVIGEGGPSEAIQGWLAIEAMDRIWGPEVNRSYARVPFAPRWDKIWRTATEMIARSMACEAQGGRLLSANADKPDDVGSWSCAP